MAAIEADPMHPVSADFGARGAHARQHLAHHGLRVDRRRFARAGEMAPGRDGISAGVRFAAPAGLRHAVDALTTMVQSIRGHAGPIRVKR
jgi:hypothetical protein